MLKYCLRSSGFGHTAYAASADIRPSLVSLAEILLQRPHPLLGTGLHQGRDLVGLVFPDQIANRIAARQDFQGGDPPGFRRGWGAAAE